MQSKKRGEKFTGKTRAAAPQSGSSAEPGGHAAAACWAARPSVALYSMTIKARVRKGRLVVDEPTGLPDGTEMELLPLDPGDWLDEADRAALHEALSQSDAGVAAGRLVDAEEILRELRSR
ncbi:MAG: hypothetical protein HYX74_08080 [Acidobacteria bacterium]|nr:hypothetical protein [Acidobacteriota bacterium]